MILLALAAAAAGPPVADAERAFAAMAQAQGQWTAFRAFAAPDAIMLVPQIVQAAEFLAPLKDPPQALQWGPDRTVTACDGSLAFSTGPFRDAAGKAGGRYLTVWRREADGAWRWVYDGGTESPHAPAPATQLTAVTADCTPPRGAAVAGKEAGGISADGTLRWRLDPGPVGRTHLFRVEYSTGGLWKLAASYVVGG